jgi:hypothetical protein
MKKDSFQLQCPSCGATCEVPGAGQYQCWNCSNQFTVAAPRANGNPRLKFRTVAAFGVSFFFLIFALIIIFINQERKTRALQQKDAIAAARNQIKPHLIKISVAIQDGTQIDRFSDLCLDFKSTYWIYSNSLPFEDHLRFAQVNLAIAEVNDTISYIQNHSWHFDETNDQIFMFLSPEEQKSVTAAAEDYFGSRPTRYFNIHLAQKYFLRDLANMTQDWLADWN